MPFSAVQTPDGTGVMQQGGAVVGLWTCWSVLQGELGWNFCPDSIGTTVWLECGLYGGPISLCVVFCSDFC